MSTSTPAASGRLRAFVRLTVSATALLLVVAGVPSVLVAAAGVPWPEPSVSAEDLLGRLAQPLSDTLVVELLALVGWACWAAFLISLSAEAAWTLRHLPLLRRNQALLRDHARTLPAHRVAAALLIGTLLVSWAAAWHPAPAQASPADGTAGLRPATQAAAPRHPSAPTRAETTRLPAENLTVPYVIAPGDTLWDIARAHLGDPLLWPRIYKLNHGQVQADGRHLSDPDDIHPGWVLRIPARAEQPTAPARPRPEAPSAAADDDRPSSHQPSASDAPRPAGDEAAETRDEQRPSASERAHPVAARPVTIGVGAASAIGITTAAGIATALAFARAHQRRRRQPDLTAPPPRPLPRAVHMANTAFLAQAHEENDSEGTLTRHPAPAEPAAPGAVMCATRGGREISVDALAIPGGIAWSGPGADAAARALAIAALGAAQRLRPEPPRAHLLIPTATAARLHIDTDGGLAACTLTRDCEHALDLVEQSLLHHARLADTGDDHDHDPEPDRPSPPMSVLLADDHPDTRDRLGAVAHRCAPGVLAVIVLGTDDWPHHACVAPDGTLTPSNPADVPALRDVNLFTLAPHPASELLDVLHSAHDRTPSVERRDQRQPVHIVPIPPPTPPTADRDFAAVHNSTTTALSRQTGHAEDPRKPVTVRLLGGFRIYAGSTGKEFGFGLRGQAREFIALLAAHPRGIRGEEIVEHLRMSADPEQANRELGNLRRAVRRSLRQATGAHQAAFLVRSGDRIRLDPVLISTDVETFLDMLRRATAGRDEAERATSLQAAVDAYGGPLCEGADYTWADGLRETLHRKAVDALVLLADHTATLNAGDPDQALALLDKAADWDPYNEPVYQRIIRLQLAAGRDDAAQRTYQLLTRRLADIEVDPDPVTTALLRRRHHPAAAR